MSMRCKKPVGASWLAGVDGVYRDVAGFAAGIMRAIVAAGFLT